MPSASVPLDVIQKNLNSSDESVQSEALLQLRKHFNLTIDSYESLSENFAKILPEKSAFEQECLLTGIKVFIEQVPSATLMKKDTMKFILTYLTADSASSENKILACKLITEMCSTPDGIMKAVMLSAHKPIASLLDEENMKVQSQAAATLAVVAKTIRIKVVLFNDCPKVVDSFVSIFLEEDAEVKLNALRLGISLAESPVGRKLVLEKFKVYIAPEGLQDKYEGETFKLLCNYLKIMEMLIESF